ncbi:hypothetical protein LZP73_03250 [Shewanella sp. AS16]|uniref:hypothetical protein n=1 Tax=Shewanella sp. AS16 TaxID=2907625 RepID=UPI001F1FD2C2|nr:hypothetical protein [Shewanella sp. AS16]MCE9685231.1 hypothetical protein [Shewanella sp. AS16]
MKSYLPLPLSCMPLLCMPLAFNAQAVAVTPGLDLGGAVRVNYAWKDYDDDPKLAFELFRAEVNYQEDGLFASAQYRWYQDMDVIHHAYFGYQLTEEQKVQAGVTQVPFGLLPYASHSFWFGATYYLGFEDDYDAGVHWQYKDENLRLDLAYFANDEYANGTRYDRYSFDVATTEGSPYEEAGQLNARIEYRLNPGGMAKGEPSHRFGVSLQYAKLDYVGATDNSQGEDATAYALAAHWQTDWQQWQAQLQYLHYDYRVAAANRLGLSAFGFPFEVASRADVVTANLSRSIDVSWGPISNLNCYNDFSQVLVSGAGRSTSTQNVTGCAITAGKFYSYLDWIAGKNMWFVDGPGVGIAAADSAWHSRLNINIGFYF